MRREPLVWQYLLAQWRRAFGLNVSRIDETLYVGGQFHARQWPALHALGIRAVLSLQAEREDEFVDPHPERTRRLLVPDFHAPSLDQLGEAVAFISDAHTAGLPVLVHCHAGVGRAPLAATAYLVSRGYRSADALSMVKQARPIVGLNPAQRARLLEWEAQLRRRSQLDGAASDPTL